MHSRDLNGNTLFGVSKRTLHHVGVLHVNAFLDSCTMSSSSRGSSSSTVSTTSTQESKVRSLKDDEEPKEKSNVMMASGLLFNHSYFSFSLHNNEVLIILHVTHVFCKEYSDVIR